MTSKTDDNPVRLVDGDVLRLEWQGKIGRVKPNVDHALEALTRLTTIKPRRASTTDCFTPVEGEAEQSKQLLALIEHGSTIDAIKLARRLYGFDLSQAKKFVEELKDAPPATAPTTESESGSDKRMP